MRHSVLALAAIGLLGCATAGRPAPGVARRFHYDASSGKCIDEAGSSGLNPLDPGPLFAHYDKVANTYSNGDAECVDFSKFDFNKRIGMGYPKLVKWSFRGALLTGARFMFANMVDADFSGADLRQFAIGYTDIEGRGDAHTQAHKACEVRAKFEIYCRR